MADTLPACYKVYVTNPNRIWQTDNVLKKELPTLAFQIAFTVLLSRLFYLIYKPFRQTRLIAQISVGFLLTRPLLGRSAAVFEFIFPVNGVLNIEVLAHIGLIFYAFLSGLEMNLNNILQVKKKAASIAIAGIIFPMVMAPALYVLLRKFYGKNDVNIHLEESTSSAFLIWSVVLTVTGFPVLAHTLSELKLLYTGLGKAALTAAMIGETYGWILFTLVVPFAINGEKAVYSVLSTTLFIVVCVFVVRPILARIIDRKTEKDEWDDNQLIFVVMGVLACSYITDILGAHGIVGAFVYGLILPHGRFADHLMSILDDFAGGFLAPLFFGGTGMRLMLATIFLEGHWPMTLLVILLLCTLKILSTIFVTFFFGMRTQDGLALGLLLNTKGAMALIMLNIAWDRSIFSVPTYAVVTSAVLLMTVAVSPIINAVYRPRKRFEQNKLKTIQKLRLDAELRILACVHNTRQATGMISIIESLNATRLSPIHVFALYLIELTGRAAALVAAHMEKPSGQPGVQNLTRSQVELENIASTFDALGEVYDAVRIETLNIVSAYSTIHEDIYNSASEKFTSLVLLPFHKQLTSEGTLEMTNAAYKEINQNVMQFAPCSVGIFVDRDFGSIPKKGLRILMLFVGGPDDREALAIAWRMAGHPGIQLSVVRIFLLDEAAEVDTSNHGEAQGILSAVMDNEKQKELDDEYVSSFRLTAVNNEDSISYSEIDVHSGEDIPSVLNDLEKNGCDLYIVGQGNCRNSRVFSNLLEWCDCLELGVIGDILASNNFGSRSSLLVIQQYGYGGMVFGKDANHLANTSNGFESLIVKTE
ncbi:cation/H(+) antiporter 15 [Cajanus cajan]|uniref:K(+)/H(+) antiporter 13 n=1 Tax=Cajanus cajan TaxID=3821 RepID=A0A151TW09_CAJCA|nr:cation/H(+) antiporter 15 [Cajanus cajan]KYP71174.1 K(+)/H(+) antiporter 13 [Cajanus cajan]